MRIISFAWTTEALLKGKKTQTRRFWKPKYAKQFKKGDIVQAYDKNPRAKGKLVAFIKLTEKPYIQDIMMISEADFQAEGGTMYWKDRLEFMGMMAEHGRNPWVIGFELLQVVK